MGRLMSKILCVAVLLVSLSAAATQSAKAGWHHGHRYHSSFHVGYYGGFRHSYLHRPYAYRSWRSSYYSAYRPYYYPSVRYYYPSYPVATYYAAPNYSCAPVCCNSSPAVETLRPAPAQQPTPAPVPAADTVPLPPTPASYRAGSRSATYSSPISRRATDVYGTLQNHDAEMAVGNRLFAAQLYHSALTKFQAASKVSPSSSDVYLHEGFAELAMGRYDRAAKVFRLATAVDENVAAAKFSLDTIYTKSNVKQFHLDRLARTALKTTNNQDHMYCLGVFLHFDGQQQRARRFFTEAGKADLQAFSIQAFLGSPKPFRTASVTKSSPGI
jgi:tetratricopeptide (TPR) repeat protein